MACSVGFYYDTYTEACLPCPIGTYGDSEAALTCSPCDRSMTTEQHGSSSAVSCVRKLLTKFSGF